MTFQVVNQLMDSVVSSAQHQAARETDISEIICDTKSSQSEGGTKLDQDKPRTELLSPIALIEIAKVLTKGAVKYESNNWRKGIAWSRVLGAALRHLFAYLAGQDKDPETGLSHIAHAGCCVMFLLEYEVTHKELDDRHKTI